VVDEAARNFVGGSSELHWAAWDQEGEKVAEGKSFTDVVSYSNPLSNRLVCVRLEATGSNSILVLQWGSNVSFVREAVSLTVGSEDTESLRAFIEIFDKEIKNTREFYSIVRVVSDGLPAKLEDLPEWVPTAFIVGGTAVTLLSVGAIAMQLAFSDRSPTQSTRPYVPVPPLAEDARRLEEQSDTTESPVQSIDRSDTPWFFSQPALLSAASLGALIAIVVCIAMYSRVFPRVQFRIGEGDERYLHLRSERLAVVLCVIGLLGSAIITVLSVT
jgi:hypothetical protein